MTDTPINISELQNQVFQKMDPVKRFKIGTEFIDMGWHITNNAIIKKHPNASHRERLQLLVKEMYNISL